MKKTYLCLAAAAFFCLASCGGNKSEKSSSEAEYDEMEETVEPVHYEEAEMGEVSEGQPVVEEAAAMEESTTTEEETKSVDSAKVASLLKEYKDLVKDYNSCLSKLKSGKIDMATAMSLLDKAQSVQSTLEGLKGDMSAAQLDELSKLAGELASSAKEAASVKVDEVKQKVTDKINEKVKDFDPSKLGF